MYISIVLEDFAIVPLSVTVICSLRLDLSGNPYLAKLSCTT